MPELVTGMAAQSAVSLLRRMASEQRDVSERNRIDYVADQTIEEFKRLRAQIDQVVAERDRARESAIAYAHGKVIDVEFTDTGFVARA